MRTLLALLLLCAVSRAEDWQCTSSSGCAASISQDGELVEIQFRKGDFVHTDQGWIVHPNQGWVKVRSNPKPHARPDDPQPRRAGRYYLWGFLWEMRGDPLLPKGLVIVERRVRVRKIGDRTVIIVSYTVTRSTARSVRG